MVGRGGVEPPFGFLLGLKEQNSRQLSLSSLGTLARLPRNPVPVTRDIAIRLKTMLVLVLMITSKLIFIIKEVASPNEAAITKHVLSRSLKSFIPG